MKAPASETLLLPSTARLLRGLRSALGEMDTTGRADLQHGARMMDLMLTHLLLRQDLAPYPSIYGELLELTNEGNRYLEAASEPERQQLLDDAVALPAELPLEAGFDRVQTCIGKALAGVRDRLGFAAVAGGDAAADYMRRSQAAEHRFYAANYRSVEASVSTAPPPLTREGFESYLLTRFPGRYQGLTKFQRLVGGFQKETILVDGELTAGGIEAMVIRAEKHDRFVSFTASEITHEYEIVRLLWQQGITVAEPLWLEADAALLGRRFMVSRRAAGGNTGDATGNSKQFPPELTRSLVETLARIHAVPLENDLARTRLGHWLDYRSMPENTRQEILAWRGQIWMDRAPPSPAFTRLFDWLEANVPHDEVPICLIHNDYGPHNILVQDNRVSAVLDWEVPRIGDPAEDLSFFLQCCGDAIDRDEALRLYGELSGNRISEYRVRYFDVLSCAKVLLSGLSATTMYQATDPALLDWCQMPVLWFGMYQPQVEAKIAAAEAARGL